MCKCQKISSINNKQSKNTTPTSSYLSLSQREPRQIPLLYFTNVYHTGAESAGNNTRLFRTGSALDLIHLQWMLFSEPFWHYLISGRKGVISFLLFRPPGMVVSIRTIYTKPIMHYFNDCLCVLLGIWCRIKLIQAWESADDNTASRYLHHSSGSWRPQVLPWVCRPFRSAHSAPPTIPGRSEEMSSHDKGQRVLFSASSLLFASNKQLVIFFFKLRFYEWLLKLKCYILNVMLHLYK